MAGGLNGPDPSAPFKPHRLILEQESARSPLRRLPLMLPMCQGCT
jgi:hypothetical protein